jgi:hypothetical protein
VGNAQLSIIASQDIGSLGPKQSAAVVVPWRWYYHCPSLALWLLLVGLLLVVKDNRRAPAWLILVPVLAVTVIWSLLARLVSLPAESAESAGGFLVTLAASWAAVWLIAPWFASRKVAMALALALATMLAGGAAYFLSVYGLPSNADFSFGAGIHVVVTLALVLGTVLSGNCCRKSYRLGRFMAWLALWVVVVTTVSIPVVTVFAAVFTADDRRTSRAL